ncbi:hypothetical protein ABPG74_019690 [Tetrahymena malaccensis]
MNKSIQLDNDIQFNQENIFQNIQDQNIADNQIEQEQIKIEFSEILNQKKNAKSSNDVHINSQIEHLQISQNDIQKKSEYSIQKQPQEVEIDEMQQTNQNECFFMANEEEAKSFTTQNDETQEQLMIQLLQWKLQQKSEISMINQTLQENKEVYENINLIIEQLKQTSENSANEEKPYNRIQRELKIFRIQDFKNADLNYEKIYISFNKRLPSEEEVFILGSFLQKCQKLEHLSIQLYEPNQCEYDLNQKRDKLSENLIQSIPQCVNLQSLDLNLNLSKEGEQFLGKLLGQCRNLIFLNLKLQNLNLLNLAFEQVASNLTKGLSEQVNLVYLDLNLSSSRIHSQDLQNVCQCFSQCKNLNFLNLDVSYSNVSQAIKYLTASLQICSNLITLNLSFSNCMLSNEDIKNLLKTIQSLETIKILELNLSSNDYIDTQEETDVVKQKSLAKLKLDLSYCKLNGENVNKIIRRFEINKDLSILHLNLSNNSFTKDSLEKQICFYRLNNLTNLSLIFKKYFENTYYQDDDIDFCFDLCQKLKSLYLKFDYFQISSKDFENICVSIQKCKTLKTLKLDLSNCWIGKVSLDSFGMSLSKCVNLNSLDINLTNNFIGVKETAIIGQALMRLQDLTQLSLDFSENKIRSIGTKNIALGLQQCKNLTSLTLSFSNSDVSVSSFQFLAQSLKEIKKMNYFSLNLYNNKLTSEAASSICTIIQDHSNIKQLALILSRNNLNLNAFKMIQSCIIKCKDLISLQLQCEHNQLSLEDQYNILKEIQQKCLGLKQFQYSY